MTWSDHIDFQRAYRFAEKISLTSESHIHSVLHRIEVEQFRAGQKNEVRSAIQRQFELFDKWKRASSNFDSKCYAIQKCVGLLFELNDKEMLCRAFDLYEQALERNRKLFDRICYYCELASWLYRFGDDSKTDKILAIAKTAIADLPVPKAKFLAAKKLADAYKRCSRIDMATGLAREFPEPAHRKPRKPVMKSLPERINDHIKNKEYSNALELMRLDKLDPYYRSVGAFSMALSLLDDGDENAAEQTIDSYFALDNNNAAVYHPTIAVMQYRLGKPDQARKTFTASRDFDLYFYPERAAKIGLFQNRCGFHEDALQTAMDTATRTDDAPTPLECIQDGMYPMTLLLLLGEKEQAERMIANSLTLIHQTKLGGLKENYDYEYSALAIGAVAGADIRLLPGVTLKQSLELFDYKPNAGFSNEYVEFEENRIPIS